MNPDQLKALEIRRDAKSRPRRQLWTIIVGVTALTGAALFFAWPRVSDKVRIAKVAAKPLERSNNPAMRPATNPGPAAVDPGAAPAKAADASGAVLTVSGYIINRERIELSPRFMGLVKWIGVKKGDPVTNTQVVVLLDDAEYKARLLEAEGRLASARAAVERSQLHYDRIAKLATEKVESKEMEDEARINLAAAKAVVAEVDGQVALIKTYLDWTIIRSPINGVVLEKLVDPNELVTPQSFGGTRGPSTALIAVADPGDLQVEIDVNEADLSKVFLNQKCRVSPEAYLERHYDGYVAEIAPEASRQKGTLQIKVQIRKPDKFLTPELSAKVEFLPAGTGEAGR
jgi:HlyD family secretion protein